MILTDYYQFRKLGLTKSKMRYDCVACTGEYKPFEDTRKGSQLWVYCGITPRSFKADVRRRATNSITNSNGDHITSVFIDLKQPLKGYGDMIGTDDALLFLFSTDMEQMEVFVARDHKNYVSELYASFLKGDLNGELDTLRGRAGVGSDEVQTQRTGQSRQ